MRTKARTAISGILAVALASCGGHAERTEPVPSPPEPQAVARCAEAMLGSNSPKWRDEATAAGAFGLFGDGRTFEEPLIRRIGPNLFHSKIPAVLDGHDAVILWVPDSQGNRVGLDYGDFDTARSMSQTVMAVVFEPCGDQPTTNWAGGLLVRGTEPVRLLVAPEDGGSPKSLLIGET